MCLFMELVTRISEFVVSMHNVKAEGSNCGDF